MLNKGIYSAIIVDIASSAMVHNPLWACAMCCLHNIKYLGIIIVSVQPCSNAFCDDPRTVNAR